MPIYNPINPTVYGSAYKRLKAIDVLHVPESDTLDLNTSDTSSQIRVSGGKLWFYTAGTWKEAGTNYLIGNGLKLDSGTIKVGDDLLDEDINWTFDPGWFNINLADSSMGMGLYSGIGSAELDIVLDYIALSQWNDDDSFANVSAGSDTAHKPYVYINATQADGRVADISLGVPHTDAILGAIGQWGIGSGVPGLAYAYVNSNSSDNTVQLMGSLGTSFFYNKAVVGLTKTLFVGSVPLIAAEAYQVLVRDTSTLEMKYVAPATIGGGGVTDGNKGDITVSSSGAAWTINAAAVNNSKINDVDWAKVTGTPTTLAGYGVSDYLQYLKGVAVSFAASIPFDKYISTMVKNVSGAIAFTPNTTGAVAGNSTLLRIMADGVNTPSFSGFYKLSASDNYNNAAGRVHVINFLFDGTDYLYSIAQIRTIDITPPSIFSIVVASTTTIDVVFTENVTVTTAGWSFKKNGAALAITSVSGSGTTWTFVVAAMAAGDAILYSYNSSTGATVDTASLPFASVTDAYVANYLGATALNFTVVANLINIGNGIWTATVNPAFTSFGLASSNLAASTDGSIELKYHSLIYSGVVLGFNAQNVNGNFTGYEAGFYIKEDGTSLSKVDSGTVTAIAGHTPIVGNYYRIKRTGSAFAISTSPDRITWTLLTTLTYSSTAQMFININILDTSRYAYKPYLS